jgi:hypothetical protein
MMRPGLANRKARGNILKEDFSPRVDLLVFIVLHCYRKEGKMSRLKYFAPTLLVLVIAFVYVSTLGSGRRVDRAAPRSRWEYKMVRIDIQKSGEPVESLNRMGLDGWEFVQVVKEEEISGMSGYFLLKRQK